MGVVGAGWALELLFSIRQCLLLLSEYLPGYGLSWLLSRIQTLIFKSSEKFPVEFLSLERSGGCKMSSQRLIHASWLLLCLLVTTARLLSVPTFLDRSDFIADC